MAVGKVVGAVGAGRQHAVSESRAPWMTDFGTKPKHVGQLPFLGLDNFEISCQNDLLGF